MQLPVLPSMIEVLKWEVSLSTVHKKSRYDLNNVIKEGVVDIIEMEYSLH